MDAVGIFDAMNRASRLMHAECDRRQLQRDIIEAERQSCGNCWKWMKNECKPEKEHGQFKSCESSGCDGFEISDWDAKWVDKLKAELAEKVKAR